MAAKYILIIDDSEMICDVISNILTESGYTVGVSHTSEEGLKQIRHKRPDAIILDLQLPDLSGIQFSQLIKNDPDLRYIPLLMCTGCNTVENKIAGLRAGADDYITKPFASQELLERVNAIFRRTELIEENFKQKAVLPKPAPLRTTQDSTPNPVHAEKKPDTVKESELRVTLASRQSLSLAWNALISPRKSFSAVASMPLADTLTPLWLLAIFHSMSAYLDSRHLADGVIGFAVILITWAAGIGLLWILLYSGKRARPYKEIARFCTAAVSPLALAALLGILYALITNGPAGEFTGSPFLLFIFIPPSSKIEIFLRCLDIFDLWVAFLLTLSAAQLFKADSKRMFFIGAWGWAFLSLTRVLNRLF